MFPYLSIYLQDVLGLSPLGAGLRLLPLTVFVFAVPIATRNIAQRTPAWILAGIGLLLVSGSLLLMHGVSATSSWTTLLAGFIVGGIGIGLANPTLAGAAEAPQIGRHDRLHEARLDAEALQRALLVDRLLRDHVVGPEQLDLVGREQRLRQILQEARLEFGKPEWQR